jgi:hypothetical protein
MSLNGVQPQDREKLPWSSNLIQTLTMDAIIRRWQLRLPTNLCSGCIQAS